MKYSGAKILMECLLEQGVDTVFGYPGGAVLFIYDELFKYRDRIRHVRSAHEQGAAHAADGYARATGRTGVCIATSGPGATNLVTGIATAYMDSVPIVAITGNVATHLLGKDSFQEVDIAGITMPVTKHNWIVKSVGELPDIVREAFIIARSGRPGPVLIDIPKDVTSTEIEWSPRGGDGASAISAHPGKTELNSVQDIEDTNDTNDVVRTSRIARLLKKMAEPPIADKDIDRAISMIVNSHRMLVYAGGGVIIGNASEELKEFVTRLNSPVALSLMGQGAFPSNHPLCTGLIGMHGSLASNQATQKADLIVAVGARFSDRVTSKTDQFATGAKILHIDIDPAEINKNVPAEFSIIGNIKVILGKILEKLPAKVESQWNGDVKAWKETKIAGSCRDNSLHPRLIMEAIHGRVGPDAIIATDVGQHQMWTAQYYPFSKPRTFLSSGGLGTMGFGMGAALGAKVSSPDKPVVLVTGDGSFRMNCTELGTMSRYSIPVLIVLVNNRTLGMVRQWQTLFYEKRYSETDYDGPPDFIALAGAYGVKAFRAEDEAAYYRALDDALAVVAGGKPALVEARIDIDECVLPMVPGGKPLDNQILDA